MPILTPDQLERQVTRLAGSGLVAAGAFLSERIKETLSVPAPRRRVTRRDGTKTWAATTKATPGAPPRKVSGSFRAKVMVRQPKPELVQVGVFNDVRARPFETWMNHPFLMRTVYANIPHLSRIMGQAMTTSKTVT